MSGPWDKLRAFTPARIGLGRHGAGLPTKAALEFQFAHARARDAVHDPLDVAALTQELAPRDLITTSSAAPDRTAYLRRPDLGRQLAAGEVERLQSLPRQDFALILADGLSARALAAHAAPLIAALDKALHGVKIDRPVIATQARVAIGDEIGQALGARLTLVLIGERPGLTVADSLGAYLTWDPCTGRRDSERNCVSNIHANGGLSYDAAATTLVRLIEGALSRGLTGTGLKDDSAAALAQ